MSERFSVENIMRDSYGDWTASSFPLDLPPHEADRRYLWTDAFAVLNFLTLAMRRPDRQKEFIGAARSLILRVHDVLGNPRSPSFPMRPSPSGNGFVGLRIGKKEARLVSDAGMEYDGMYWHYIDKWLFALQRFLVVSGGDATISELARRLVDDLHPFFFDGKAGMRWKINVDCTPIPGLERASTGSTDTLSGWVVYHLLHRVGVDCTAQIADLDPLVGDTRCASTWEPLGFGLWWWKCQWLGTWADRLRRALTSDATAAMSVQHISLPFRLYGALLGAKLSRNSTLITLATSILDHFTSQELQSTDGRGLETINKMMFVAAHDPLAWSRRSDEEIIEVP